MTLHKGTHVVAVISPGCPFSRQAITDIEQDPRLRELVGDHTLWLGNPRSILHFADYQQWHRDHPGKRMVIAAIRDEGWFLHDWAFPSFFVLRDGLVLGSLRGWPPDGSHRDALVALLELAAPRSDPPPH